MSEINKIIDNFFEEAAWTIMYDNRKCFADLKEKWVADLTLTNECPLISEIQEEYLKLLDDIDKLVYGKIDENNSYVSYYKNKELFETDINISDIVEKVKQSSNSGDMAESLKEEVRKKLLEKNGYRRIAQLYYYKKNHKWYAEELEKAYREVIVEIIDGDEENCFIVPVCRKVESRTQEIVGCAANAAYFDIYHDDVSDKYKPNIEDYIADINSNTPLCVMAVNNSTKPVYKYYKNVIDIIDDSQRISIGASCEDLCQIADLYENKLNIIKLKGKKEKEEAGVSRRKYDDFFKLIFTNIAGYDYYNINRLCNNKFQNKFILKTMSNDLNYILLALLTMAGGNKEEYKNKKFSRFVLINDVIDYGIVREAIIIYRSLIKAAIKNMELQETVIESCEADAVEEVELFLNSDVKKNLPELIDEYLKKCEPQR